MFDEYIQIPVIAKVVGGHRDRLDDYKGDVTSIIRLMPNIPEGALQGIEEFSHLEVIWHFSLGSDNDIELEPRSPRGNPDWLYDWRTRPPQPSPSRPHRCLVPKAAAGRG